MLKELFRKIIAALKRFLRLPRGIGLTDSELASKLYGPGVKRRFKIAGSRMPKCQPCNRCNAGSPRAEKTRGGARYRCRTHGPFFVPASIHARGY